MNETFIEEHDRLLENIPEGASHDESACEICKFKNNTDEPDGRGDMEETLKELEDAKAKAVALQAELDILKAGADAAAIQQQIDEAKAEAEKAQAEAEAARDLAEADAAAARAELAEFKSAIEALEAEIAEAARIESVKEERASRVKELTSFPESKINERIDEWARLSDEAFEARLSEWAELTASLKSASADLKPDTAKIVLNTRTDSAEVVVGGYAAYKEAKSALSANGAQV